MCLGYFKLFLIYWFTKGVSSDNDVPMMIASIYCFLYTNHFKCIFYAV